MARMSHCLEALGDTYPVFLGICMCVVVVSAVIGLWFRMFLLVTSQEPSQASLEVIPVPYYVFVLFHFNTLKFYFFICDGWAF